MMLTSLRGTIVDGTIQPYHSVLLHFIPNDINEFLVSLKKPVYRLNCRGL